MTTSNQAPAHAEVILVDVDGNEIGAIDKSSAHRQGLLHRAFSIFIFDRGGRVLLQQRSLTKYHSGGLWSNTCCSHPRPGELTQPAARRRLQEEMGISCELEEIHRFTYRADVPPDLIEHEYDHVFTGEWQGEPTPDAEEVLDYRWISPDALDAEIQRAPEQFTAWLRLCHREVCARHRAAQPLLHRPSEP